MFMAELWRGTLPLVFLSLSYRRTLWTASHRASALVRDPVEQDHITNTVYCLQACINALILTT